ncbi:MAG: D-alanine--D-alanine ligase [Clostridia bacterium]|nr:D-alanine--D-alanine ligase [Clostridia bacterium]
MKTNVAVFFGGRSVEHEVAVISAVQAMNYINTEKYDITPVYISKNGEMYTAECMTNIDEYRDIDALIKKSQCVTLIKNGNEFDLIELKKGLFKKKITSVDIAFPIVHGTNCEDGSLVGWFELLGLPYVSCDVLSAAVGMDKAVCKYVLQKAGVPVLDCVEFYAKEYVVSKTKILKEIEEKFSYPVIVKPANLGSSVGISKADDHDELLASIKDAMNYAQKIIVEPAVVNLRELNCSVVGDSDECETSVIEEPIMTGKILSYEDKYKGGEKGAKGGNKNGAKSAGGMASLSRQIPAKITKKIQSDVEKYAKETFKALGCNGVVRIDFLFDTKENKVYVNEINTIPGSLSFYLWEPKGVKYSELLSRMIELGFKRARNKENLKFSFETNILENKMSFGSKGSKGSKI